MPSNFLRCKIVSRVTLHARAREYTDDFERMCTIDTQIIRGKQLQRDFTGLIPNKRLHTPIYTNVIN